MIFLQRKGDRGVREKEKLHLTYYGIQTNLVFFFVVFFYVVASVCCCSKSSLPSLYEDGSVPFSWQDGDIAIAFACTYECSLEFKTPGESNRQLLEHPRQCHVHANVH